jgi:hypothetical protein
LPPSYADCPEGWEPQPSGTFRACAGIVIYVGFFNLMCLFLCPVSTKFDFGGWIVVKKKVSNMNCHEKEGNFGE